MISICTSYYERQEELYHELRSFEILYQNQGFSDYEIVITDDGSRENYKAKPVVDMFKEKIDINLIYYPIEKKGEMVGCALPINISIKNSKYDTILLNHCELIHIDPILITLSEQKNIENSYYIFECSAVMQKENQDIIDNLDWGNKNVLNQIKNCLPEMNTSWWAHKSYAPDVLCFCTAISRQNIFKMRGEDEDYREGCGFDDTDFGDRVVAMGLHITHLDNTLSIHPFHKVRSWKNNLDLTSHNFQSEAFWREKYRKNKGVYQSKKSSDWKRNLDKEWGSLE